MKAPRLSAPLLRLSSIIIAVIVVLSLIVGRVFGPALIGTVTLVFITSLMTMRLPGRQRISITLCSLAVICLSSVCRGNAWAAAICLVIAVAVSIIADRRDAGAAKLLPGVTAYIILGSGDATTLAISVSAALSMAAALFLLYTLPMSGKLTPVTTAEHPATYAALVTLTLLFTVWSQANGLPHGYWMVLTLCSAIQPGLSRTRSYIRSQIIGTTIGAFAAIMSAVLLPRTLLLTLVIPLIFIAVYASIARLYRVAAATTTASMVVLLSQISVNLAVQTAAERITLITLSLVVVGVAAWGAWWFDSRRPMPTRPG